MANLERLGLPAEWLLVRLPGQGEVYREDCGKFIVRVRQEDWYGPRVGQIKAVVGFNSCGRVSCQVCWKSAVRKMARRIKIRMCSVVSVYDLPLHVVISPPMRLLSDLTPEKLIEESRKIAQRVGLRGGRDMLHENRGHNASEFEFSPHVQGLYVGSVDGNKVREVYGETGWIVTVMGSPGHYRRTPREIEKTIEYELGHAAVKGGRVLGGYWGVLVPRLVKKALTSDQWGRMRFEEKRTPKHCPEHGYDAICECVLVVVKPNSQGWFTKMYWRALSPSIRGSRVIHIFRPYFYKDDYRLASLE